MWFIEQQKVDHESVPSKLFYLVQELGCEAVSRPYIPFKEDHDFSFLPTDRPVIFYGSINMVKAFKKSPQNGLVKPFCWFDFEEMSCRSYYTHWGRHLLQRNYAFYTFGEMRRLKGDLYSRHGAEDLIFIRPDTNDKVFTGVVVHRENFDCWFETQLEWGVGLLQLCVVASPEEIEAEYRLVVADDSVVSASRYRLHGQIDKEAGCPENVREFANEVLRTVPWTPAPIFCLDVAISGGNPRLLEVGEINCAGLYEADLREVALAMMRVAERTNETAAQ